MQREGSAAPAFQRRLFGDIEVTTLSDGVIEASPRVIGNMPPADVESALIAAGVAVPPSISVNAFAFRVGGRVTLVDTGAGDKMGPTLGKLTQSLELSGIRVDQVDTVLLTHMHPDHSNGLTHANGAAVFPNAELVLHQDEHDHWLDDGSMARASPRLRRENFEAARHQLAAYRGRLRLFRDGLVLPHVEAVALSGHTPGHTGYRIASGADALLIWGDVVHIPELQIPNPDVCVVLDTDSRAAASTRRRALDMVSVEGITVAGMHLHYPGFCKIARDAGRFVFVQ